MHFAVINSLDEALAAAADARGKPPFWLVSPPGAAANWGAGYFVALVDDVRSAMPAHEFKGALDTAGDPGYAQAAIRAGVDAVIFTGPADLAEKLADIAAQAGCDLWTSRPGSR